jgi:hypothetical protein
MSGMCYGQKQHHIQHDWNVSWSKRQIQHGQNRFWSQPSDSPCTECVVVKTSDSSWPDVAWSIQQIQHVQNVLW